MEFCPECKSIMQPMEKGGKKVLGCSCGYVKKEAAKPIVEEVEEPKDMEVVDEDEQENLPTTDEECPECGHKEAYFWLQQTRAGDEPETKFLKCTECKHTWRDYS